jgi:hypothetical protein
MKQEIGKYYLRFAWFPKTLDNNEKVWLENYYEAHFNLPIVDPVYTISRISVIDYLVESIKGNIVDRYSINCGLDIIIDRMLNAAKPLPFTGAGTDGKIQKSIRSRPR